MLEQNQLQQLQNKSVQELQEIEKGYKGRQKELETLKSKGGKNWTMEAQEELNEVTLFLVDIEELIEKKESEATTEESTEKKESEATTTDKYVPAKGTEKLVHLKISKGRRFDPESGKEITKPYVQTFTYGEWKLFQQNHKNIGFVIVETLHNPYESDEKTSK